MSDFEIAMLMVVTLLGIAEALKLCVLAAIADAIWENKK